MSEQSIAYGVSAAPVRPWPIERKWIVTAGRAAREEVGTIDLLGYRACAMLGTAGLGKTYEIERMVAFDREQGLDVRYERLAELGQSAEGLESRLKALAVDLLENSVIYLDALDEVMVPVKTAASVLKRWIREELAATRPMLRISCRSGVWPEGISAACNAVYGEVASARAYLQVMTSDDVRTIVELCKCDPDVFEAAVKNASADILAIQPLTLEMLLRVYLHDGALPRNRNALFERGVHILAAERTERLEAGTAITDISLDELEEGAERVACFGLLSGRDTVDLSEAESSSTLGRIELECLPGKARPLDYNHLLALGRSGLCEGAGSRRFRFAHRQFAEYLAGRRIARLPLHQARGMLASGLGWQSGVAGPLRETAAFASIESPEVAAWICDCDPEVIGLSDVADNELRRRATLKLLAKFQRRELTDVHAFGRDEIELAGFRYEGAEDDLRPFLLCRDADSSDALQCTIEMIESWNLHSLSDDLADVFLDVGAPLDGRKSAGYALARIGTPLSRRRLRPMLGDRPDDPYFDLKGLALRCMWPDLLSVDELLSSITRRRVHGYSGAYDGFLFELDRSGFDADGARLAGLSWARRFVDRDDDIGSIWRLVKRIAVASLKELNCPQVADALAELLLAAAVNRCQSPLAHAQELMTEDEQVEPISRYSPLEADVNARRSLIEALTVRATNTSALWWAAREAPGLL